VNLHPPGLEYLVKLTPQDAGWLAVKNLENGPANGFFTRYALHAGLAFSVPGLNAILAVNHVQPEWQGVHDLLEKTTGYLLGRRAPGAGLLATIALRKRSAEKVGYNGDKLELFMRHTAAANTENGNITRTEANRDSQ